MNWGRGVYRLSITIVVLFDCQKRKILACVFIVGLKRMEWDLPSLHRTLLLRLRSGCTPSTHCQRESASAREGRTVKSWYLGFNNRESDECRSGAKWNSARRAGWPSPALIPKVRGNMKTSRPSARRSPAKHSPTTYHFINLSSPFFLRPPG